MEQPNRPSVYVINRTAVAPTRIVGQYESRDAARVFNRLPDDAKRALALGDLDIEDAIDEELNATQRRSIRNRARAWGRKNKLEGMCD